MLLTHHHRVELVDEWNEHRRRHDDQEQVGKKEVGGPEGHLDDLDHKLTGRLRERRRAETTTIPLSRPPCLVGLLVLQLTREEDGDEDLLDSALNRNNGDDTEHSVRRVPELEEPLRKRLEQVVT